MRSYIDMGIGIEKVGIGFEDETSFLESANNLGSRGKRYENVVAEICRDEENRSVKGVQSVRDL